MACVQAEKIAPIPLSKFKTVERSAEKDAQLEREREAKQAAQDIEAEGKSKKGGFFKGLFGGRKD